MLQATYEYQTLVCRLTGMEMANASIYDAATALAEAALMACRVTGRSRAPNLPDIAPIAEAGLPDYEAVPYYTLSTSSKVSADIVRKLAADVDVFVKAADLQRRWSELGIAPLGGTAEAAVKRNAVETAKWSKVIKVAGIRVD